MDKAQRKALQGLRVPDGITVDPATGFVYRAGWPRPGMRLEPVGARFTVRAYSFRTGGYTEPEVVRVDAAAIDVAVALATFAALPVTRTSFPAWRRALGRALYGRVG